MDKTKFSKQYQKQIEKAERGHAKVEAFHNWCMPRKRSDLHKLKRQLLDRLRGPVQVSNPDWQLTKIKLEEVDDALQAKNTRRVFIVAGVAAVAAVAGVAVTIYFGLLGG